MSYHSSSPRLLVLAFVSFFCLFLVVKATVPANETFQYVNQGDFGEYTVEYLATYRILPIAAHPFQFAFYNTTPGLYTLGLRMGHQRSESILRWVWDANRGDPVHENATLTFGRDGNLILAEANGRIVWQTSTSNKGVVGLYLLSNGNLVLYNSKGRYVWESFNYPTDTLLVGQSFRRNGPSKIISRVSALDGTEGPYSYGIEQDFLVLYYKPKSSTKPLLYYKSTVFEGSFTNLTFQAELESVDSGAYYLLFSYTQIAGTSTYTLSVPKYDATYSMLRVDFDGNLRIYTYDDNVDNAAWDVTYVLFDRDEDHESECKLPRRCGSFGVCEDNQCVACPRPQGLLGWNKNCAPPKLPKCKVDGTNVKYYKVVGVEHYTYDYTSGTGPLKVGECKSKCDKDCECLGFFYREKSAMCLTVGDLGSLVKVADTSHVVYIKISV